jgi:hypothetical protein
LINIIIIDSIIRKMSKSHYIIEDVQSIYASIQEETDSVEEINNFAGDVYAAVATSMLHEGYSASGILGFLSTASDEEILERFGDYDENFIAESTISEEYVNEQVEQLDEFVGAALRVLGSGAKAAKFGQGGVLSKLGAGLRGAGQAVSRVAKQGPRASSVVRSGLSKLRSAAGAGLGKLKQGAQKVGGAVAGAASKLPGPVGRVAKTLVPGAAGFALGRATAPKSEAPKASQPAAEVPKPAAAPKPAAPKPAAPKPNPNVATSPKTGEKTTFQRRLPTMKELRAAQAARAQAKAAGASKGEAEYQAVKAGVGAEKPPAAKPKSGGPGGYQLPAGAKPKTVEAVKRESYDLVLDYLLSEGHAETVEEAHYIMLRLEADHIQEIVESVS